MTAPAAPALAYAEGLAAGELRFQHCTDCEQAVFYPRVLCPHCGSESLQWRTSAGLGTVYATTVIHKRGTDPYNVALVDLDEGFRMMSRVEGSAPEDVTIGTRVGVTVITEDEAPLAVFRPLEEAVA
ncbi:Zn-ribbon domain-containing OB-fold protein [Streptomyces sp. BE230]|uniref:Zn-ribbon domain-containing OB-fold protein n=1 Tax=Streptomyces sp. BE230 TaxID=3002526 RepID=UPI002ED22332|nr:OB-fold domain-containing protein [Streptomyces sp. BE230]